MAVDIVTTSEVSVSLSLDDTTSLNAVVSELNEIAAVTVERGRAIVCVVGEGLRTTAGIAGRVFRHGRRYQCVVDFAGRLED